MSFVVPSDLLPTCWNWVVYGLTHTLESIMPDGDWMTSINCFLPVNFANAN